MRHGTRRREEEPQQVRKSLAGPTQLALASSLRQTISKELDQIPVPTYDQISEPLRARFLWFDLGSGKAARLRACQGNFLRRKFAL